MARIKKRICWAVFVRFIHRSHQRNLNMYTHMLIHTVCVHTCVCVFISPFPLTKCSKGEYFWGTEISFMLLSVKHKGILRWIWKDYLMLVTREHFTFLKALKI